MKKLQTIYRFIPIFFWISLMSTETSFAQGIINNGAKIIIGTGANLIIGGQFGSFVNKTTISDGTVDLSGKFVLTGNLTNEVLNSSIFRTVATNSEMIFNGTNTQTIGGTTTTTFNFDKLTINNGAVIEATAGKKINCANTLSINGTFTLLSNSTAGTATLIDNGQEGSGIFKAQQYISAGRNWYFSSPVTGATSAAINASESYPIYTYSESTGSTTPWRSITNTDTILALSKGYIANIQSSGVLSFSGSRYNSGEITINLNRTAGQHKEGFNLIGNPYPAYVNWDDAKKNNVETTYWLRTKNAGNTAYVFDTYNSLAQIGTSLNGSVLNAHIPPMQAVWVRVKPAVDGNSTVGSVVLNNSMRSHAAGSDLRMKSKSSTNSDRKIIRLQVSNGVNSDETILFQDSNASNSLDEYDSSKMRNSNAEIPEIFSTIGSEQLVINGLNSLSPSTEIAIGFSTGVSNNFTISGTEIKNFDDNMQIILNDKLEGSETDLTKEQSYNFNSDITNSTDRFSLTFKTRLFTTNLDNSDELRVSIYRNKINNIVINLADEINKNAFVEVFDILGNKCFTKRIKSNKTEIATNYTSGIYIVKLYNGEKNISKKIQLN